MDILSKQRNAVISNLKDAGCRQDFIDRFIAFAEQSQTKELFAMLAAHKKALLEAAHENNHRIDCLDYLTYKLKKELKNKI